MTARQLLTVLVLSLLQAAQYAQAGRFQTTLFESDGDPTPQAHELLSAVGVPVKLLRGADIPMASLDKQGNWQILRESACIVMGFRVSADGVIDKLVVLDSRPADVLAPAVRSAMSQWRFEKSEKPIWAVLPLEFGIGRSQDQVSWSRVEPRRTGIIEADRQRCLTPVRQLRFELPAGLVFAQEPDPAYPSPDWLRAHPAGCVTVAFRIAADGVPTDLELLDAKPDQSFVDVAATDVQAWRFKPPVVVDGVKPRFGFARFGYGLFDKGAVIPECMTAAFASQHYQSSEQPQ